MLDTPASWVWVCFQMVPFWNKLGWMEANMMLNMKKWLDKAWLLLVVVGFALGASVKPLYFDNIDYFDYNRNCFVAGS